MNSQSTWQVSEKSVDESEVVFLRTRPIVEIMIEEKNISRPRQSKTMHYWDHLYINIHSLENYPYEENEMKQASIEEQ